VTCRRCGQDKPAEDFAILLTRTRRGRHSVCKVCELEMSIEAQRNPGRRYPIYL
jgi:hypothetical protein